MCDCVPQVNFFAVLAMTQAVAPYMIEQRSGLIGEATTIKGHLLVTEGFCHLQEQ